LENSVARYLAQLDTADRQEPSEELAATTEHLKEKLVKLESEMQRLAVMERLMLASPDQRLDKNPHAMRQRRETAEHPFGTLKMRMGATHFMMKRLPKVATEMALHVLAYNLTRVMNIMGIQPLMAAIRV